MTEPCFVEFTPLDARSLQRTQDAFATLRAMKSGDEAVDEARLEAALEPRERARFWDPTPEEMDAWNALWSSTPVEVRLSADMPTPPWDLGSMYEAIWNGEYELLDIVERDGKQHLRFEPHAWPFGGVGALVAFVECFGHRVLGFDDGTGYVDHVPPKAWHSAARAGD